MTKLYINLTSDIIDKDYEDEIISIEYSENILDSNLSVNPGICEQYANVSFKDSGKFIRNLALNNALEAYDTILSIHKIDNGNDVVDAEFSVYDWDIDMCRESIKINGRDPSYQFNDISVSVSQLRNTNVYNLIVELFSYVNYTYEFEQYVQVYCKNMYLPNNFYKANTLYELLNKICQLALLRIYWYKNRFVIGRVII